MNLPLIERGNRRLLVISAVNLVEGGTLKIMRECIAEAEATLPADWDILAFVHREDLVDCSRCRLVAMPHAKASWLRRVLVEWFEFSAHAKALKPDLWLSLHDMTPRVGKVRQAVYCHNPMPFFKMHWRDVWLQPVLFVFQLAYGFFYRVGLARNEAVIVQQSWLRDAFRKWASRPRIIVATPVHAEERIHATRPRRTEGPAVFFYPALPRVFKNFELLCAAARILERDPEWKSEITITVDGTENRYARWLHKTYGEVRGVNFVGRQNAQGMAHWYARADCVLFPSRLETWGLPITEAKLHGLPMFVADLPYAHETVGNYDAVEFIDPEDAQALAGRLLAFQQNRVRFTAARQAPPQEPYASNWKDLLMTLIAPAAASR